MSPAACRAVIIDLAIPNVFPVGSAFRADVMIQKTNPYLTAFDLGLSLHAAA